MSEKGKTLLPSEEKKTLRHIAFIMDGNGRWAQNRGLPREYGHKYGAETFRRVLRHCGKLGIEVATFYVFSTENWKRPQKEVDSLMRLLAQYLDECEQELKKNDLRFIFLGDKSPFSKSMRSKMEHIESISKQHHRIVNLALNYGGRSELVAAANALLQSGKTHITERELADALYTRESPDPDMIVRTGGDFRISNFLLWQAAYAELYFTDTLWPDFKEEELEEAVNCFKNRNRRFGGV